MTGVRVTRVCPGCGRIFSYLRSRSNGRTRKWCSEGCRKKTLYGGICVDCGARTTYAKDGGGAQRCNSCQRNQNAERNTAVLQLWEQGYTNKEIGGLLGLTEGQVQGAVQDTNPSTRMASLHRARNRTLWPQLLALREQGAGDTAIARELGLKSAHNVAAYWQSMRKQGVVVPPRGQKAPAQKAP